MEKPKILILIAELNSELQDLQNLHDEMLEYYENPKFDPTKPFDLRAISSVLHDYYTCLEKIFLRIANKIDGNAPKGDAWHMELLDQMSYELADTRPLVIHKDVKEIIYQYLRFRHVVRNVYGFSLKWEKMNDLILNLDSNHELILREIHNFVAFLQEITQE